MLCTIYWYRFVRVNLQWCGHNCVVGGFQNIAVALRTSIAEVLEASIEEVLRASIAEVLEASIEEVLRPSIAEVVLGMIGIISYQRSPGRCRDRPGQILPSRFSPNSARSQIHTIHIQGKRHHIHIQKILVWETLFFLHRCTLCTVTYKKCTGDVWQVTVSRICLIDCSFLCFCLFGVVACALYKKCTAIALVMFGGWQLAGCRGSPGLKSKNLHSTSLCTPWYTNWTLTNRTP